MADIITSENAKQLELQTHYYKATYEEIKDEYMHIVKKMNYKIVSDNDEYCEVYAEAPHMEVIAKIIMQDPEEIIRLIKVMEPSFGGINLEDISAPRCFEIETRLKEELSIPVFHDDQHGTAIVVGAAVLNALKIIKKDIRRQRVERYKRENRNG